MRSLNPATPWSQPVHAKQSNQLTWQKSAPNNHLDTQTSGLYGSLANKKEDKQHIPQKRKLEEDKKIIEIKEPISETKQPSKTAKDWGTASNDPRNKTK